MIKWLGSAGLAALLTTGFALPGHATRPGPAPPEPPIPEVTTENIEDVEIEVPDASFQDLQQIEGLEFDLHLEPLTYDAEASDDVDSETVE